MKKLKLDIRKIKPYADKLVPDIDDILILLGAAGVFGGIWQIYHPAAYIIGGSILLFLGLNKKKKQ